MSVIKWREDFSVDVPVFDEQHKQIIALLNQLLDALKGQSVAASVPGILRELESYANEHFAQEEAYLSERNYPELDVQKKEHRHFAEQLKQLETIIARRDLSFSEMNVFLRKWFKQHILSEDMKYKKYTQ